MANEESMKYSFFRVFNAASPDKKRKLNIDPTHSFNIYNDSLMDYASIIGYKLNKPWWNFNRLIAVQIPLCPNDCWHCYLPKELYIGEDDSTNRFEKLTAKELVKCFIDQRNQDQEAGKLSNVLRISGGEPFLLPELILECLEEIRERKLNTEVFVWTETNLEPFIGESGKAFMDRPENKIILSKLGEFKNFLVHPCFHGLFEDEIKTITKVENEKITLEDLIGGIKRLLDNKIDIYPTVGSNVCNPGNLQKLFYLLQKLDNALPLKLALINYDLRYEPIEGRLKERKEPKLNSRFAALRIWNKLMIKNIGIGYGILPRHLSLNIKLDNPKEKDPEYLEEIVYFFKSSKRHLYHREVLDILAYPDGFILSELEYEKDWVQEDLFFHMSFHKEQYKNKKAIFFYAEEKTNSLIPLRIVEIIDVTRIGRYLKFSIKLLDYLSINQDDVNYFTQALRSYFGQNTLPPNRPAYYLTIGERFYDTNKEGNSIVSKAFETTSLPFNCALESSNFTDIVNTLTQYERPGTSLFYRISSTDLKLVVSENSESYFEVNSGKAFYLDIEHRLPNYEKFDENDSEARTIHFEISSSLIKPIGESSFILSKYGNKRLAFITDVTNKVQDVSLSFYSKKTEFEAAKINLVVKILPNNGKQALNSLAFSILFVLGLWFLSIVQSSTESKNLDSASVVFPTTITTTSTTASPSVSLIKTQPATITTTTTAPKIDSTKAPPIISNLWIASWDNLKMLFPNLGTGVFNFLYITVLLVLFFFVFKAVQAGLLNKFW